MILGEKLIPQYETQFEDMSSRLQKWVDKDYDLSLINYNLLFPLLKKLIEAGNKNALEVLNTKIVNSDDTNVKTWLKSTDLIKFLE